MHLKLKPQLRHSHNPMKIKSPRKNRSKMGFCQMCEVALNNKNTGAKVFRLPPTCGGFTIKKIW